MLVYLQLSYGIITFKRFLSETCISRDISFYKNTAYVFPTLSTSDQRLNDVLNEIVHQFHTARGYELSTSPARLSSTGL